MSKSPRKSANAKARADKPKSNRGGKRPGAGRPRRGELPASAVGGLDLKAALTASPPDEIDTVAQKHAHTAISALVKQLSFGQSESAKVAAANAVLDRGYGKPAVEIGGDAMLPFMMAPSATQTVSGNIRAEARKYANLAIEVLRRIADSGTSESARVTAAKSLLDRGLGTAAPARMGDELANRPLGKKEEAAVAAEKAATGRYATPPAPRTSQAGAPERLN